MTSLPLTTTGLVQLRAIQHSQRVNYAHFNNDNASTASTLTMDNASMARNHAVRRTSLTSHFGTLYHGRRTFQEILQSKKHRICNYFLIMITGTRIIDIRRNYRTVSVPMQIKSILPCHLHTCIYTFFIPSHTPGRGQNSFFAFLKYIFLNTLPRNGTCFS